jgi:hypothetical protein
MLLAPARCIPHSDLIRSEWLMWVLSSVHESTCDGCLNDDDLGISFSVLSDRISSPCFQIFSFSALLRTHHMGHSSFLYEKKIIRGFHCVICSGFGRWLHLHCVVYASAIAPGSGREGIIHSPCPGRDATFICISWIGGLPQAAIPISMV